MSDSFDNTIDPRALARLRTLQARYQVWFLSLLAVTLSLLAVLWAGTIHGLLGIVLIMAGMVALITTRRLYSAAYIKLILRDALSGGAGVLPIEDAKFPQQLIDAGLVPPGVTPWVGFAVKAHRRGRDIQIAWASIDHGSESTPDAAFGGQVITLPSSDMPPLVLRRRQDNRLARAVEKSLPCPKGSTVEVVAVPGHAFDMVSVGLSVDQMAQLRRVIAQFERVLPLEDLFAIIVSDDTAVLMIGAAPGRGAFDLPNPRLFHGGDEVIEKTRRAASQLTRLLDVVDAWLEATQAFSPGDASALPEDAAAVHSAG